MTTLQEWLDNKYPTPAEKEQLKEIIINQGSQQKEIDGQSLNLTNYPNLEKINFFNKTFGKFPNSSIEVYTVKRGKGWAKPLRHEWIRDNFPDFDFYIEDNTYNISTTKENHPKDKIYVLTDYKFSRNLQGDNIYHVKTTVSDIKSIHFAIGALEYRTKKLEQGISALKQQNRPSYSTPTWLITFPIIGGILALLLLIITWKSRKQKNKT